MIVIAVSLRPQIRTRTPSREQLKRNSEIRTAREGPERETSKEGKHVGSGRGHQYKNFFPDCTCWPPLPSLPTPLPARRRTALPAPKPRWTHVVRAALTSRHTLEQQKQIQGEGEGLWLEEEGEGQEERRRREKERGSMIETPLVPKGDVINAFGHHAFGCRTFACGKVVMAYLPKYRIGTFT